MWLSPLQNDPYSGHLELLTLRIVIGAQLRRPRRRRPRQRPSTRLQEIEEKALTVLAVEESVKWRDHVREAKAE